MRTDDMAEFVSKELLKKAIDNNTNYPEKVKADLKAIIEHSKTPEEMCVAILTYFGTYNWQ